jgi:hypothetical protein
LIWITAPLEKTICDHDGAEINKNRMRLRGAFILISGGTIR